MAHVYFQKLDFERRAIRTVTLLPGLWESPIRCLLRNTILEHAVYHAVSYAWGDPDDRCSILVNNMDLEIPGNMGVALRYLRKHEETLELWIDSICINQKDDREKERQIALMGEIFQRSTCTYIWLGVPETIKTARSHGTQINPFLLIKHFAENRHLYEMPFFPTSQSFEGSSQAESFPDAVQPELIWEAFQDAVHKPWWSRFWCVQECLLSPSAIIILGDWRIPWATLKLCETNYKRHLSSCCFEASGQLPLNYTFYVDQNVSNMYMGSTTEVCIHPRLSLSLDLLVRTFRNKSCQDPRDKVYGILGLADEMTKSEIRIDYKACTKSVYLDMMRLIFRREAGSLRCLTGLGFNSSDHGLPSWVRNFDAPIQIAALNYELTRFDLYNLYDASKSTDARYSFDNQGLVSEGVYIDKIRQVGRAVENRDWQHVYGILKSWLEMVHVISSDVSPAFNFTGPNIEPFFRSVLGDVLVEGQQAPRRLTQDDMECLKSWLNLFLDSTSKGADPPMGPWIQSMLPGIYGRTMFITERGHIGMCYPESRVDDQVWVLYGGRVPFVLRQNRQSNGGLVARIDGHLLVGDCYLNDFMDGECLQDNYWEKQTSLLIQ